MEDMETWLLEVGDELIEKKAASGIAALSPAEHAIYCMWALDYAVRNAGSLDALEDVHEAAIEELAAFARLHRIEVLSAWVEKTSDEEAFIDEYYKRFDATCIELKRRYENQP